MIRIPKGAAVLPEWFSSRRDLECERLRGFADSLRGGGQRFLLPPAQRALIQLSKFALNRGGYGDDELARAVGNSREHAGALVELEPGGTFLDSEARDFDVPVVHGFFSGNDASPQVAQ